MGDTYAMSLMQLARAQGYDPNNPPLPPPRPQNPNHPGLQWQWGPDPAEAAPPVIPPTVQGQQAPETGYEEWEKQPPPEGQMTKDQPTHNPDFAEIQKRLQLFHALATQYGWNI